MSSPLTLLMPVLPGTSFAAIAAALAGSQKALQEALLNIGTVHFARFLLLDRSQPNLQPVLDPTATSDTLIIAIITEYDGDFDDYISDFVAQLGAVFDTLLNFVVGGAAIVPVANNVAAFEAFLATNDASQHAPNQSLYQAYPQTVQEILAAVSA